MNPDFVPERRTRFVQPELFLEYALVTPPANRYANTVIAALLPMRPPGFPAVAFARLVRWLLFIGGVPCPPRPMPLAAAESREEELVPQLSINSISRVKNTDDNGDDLDEYWAYTPPDDDEVELSVVWAFEPIVTEGDVVLYTTPAWAWFSNLHDVLNTYGELRARMIREALVPIVAMTAGQLNTTGTAIRDNTAVVRAMEVGEYRGAATNNILVQTERGGTTWRNRPGMPTHTTIEDIIEVAGEIMPPDEATLVLLADAVQRALARIVMMPRVARKIGAPNIALLMPPEPAPKPRAKRVRTDTAPERAMASGAERDD